MPTTDQQCGTMRGRSQPNPKNARRNLQPMANQTEHDHTRRRRARCPSGGRSKPLASPRCAQGARATAIGGRGRRSHREEPRDAGPDAEDRAGETVGEDERSRLTCARQFEFPRASSSTARQASPLAPAERPAVDPLFAFFPRRGQRADSTNHPERNVSAPKWKTPSMSAKAAKSNSELTGPNTSKKRLDGPDVPPRRALELLLIDVVGGDRHLPGVVQEVVQQDLRGEHRQETVGTPTLRRRRTCSRSSRTCR